MTAKAILLGVVQQLGINPDQNGGTMARAAASKTQQTRGIFSQQASWYKESQHDQVWTLHAH
uniref:Uncharacterized protein n=1 Tax=Leersia perrieri TaxID=77586 RepID=A0A0D9XNM8_9ORYZ